MKTIVRKVYKKPLMETVLIQSQASMLAGSGPKVDVNSYGDGGEMGDDDD